MFKQDVGSTRSEIGYTLNYPEVAIDFLREAF